MAKTVDVPTELREFNKVFNSVAGYKWDYGDVFEDLLDFSIACMSPQGDKEVGDYFIKKYGDEKVVFSDMLKELMKVYTTGTKGNDWYDGIGLFYEVISSHSKSKRLGQFFTPPPICDFMASIVGTEDKGMRVSDPSCGSGRMLLAHHVQSPSNFYFGCDIDRICAKMTALNMCLHGVRGQVICADGLFVSGDWRFGYEINRCLAWGLPSIEKLSKEYCIQCKIHDRVVAEMIEQKEIKQVNKAEYQ